MGKRVAIVQSCYIPWKGYFDLINGVDEFVLLDDVQYTRADWRNRNRIKTSDGTAKTSEFLRIPLPCFRSCRGIFALQSTPLSIDSWQFTGLSLWD